MSWTVGVSTHPQASHATGEVIGQVLERLGTEPDVVVVFVSGHRRELDEVTAALRATLRPGLVLGTTAGTVVGGRREIETPPALAVLAGRAAGATGLRLRTRRVERGTRLDGLDPTVLARAHSLIVLADRHSFPAAAVLEHLRARHPHLCVVGGVSTAGASPGDGWLLLDDDVEATGAVAMALDGPLRVRPVVSHGCRPIGDPLTVTAADGPVVHGLGGRPAAERLRDALRALSDEERLLATTGLHAGLVVDEHREAFVPGDFLIRAVRSVDRATGAVAIGDRAPVGTTLQFQVRDAELARRDLAAAVSDGSADAALLFTCAGRGSRFFGDPGADAEAVADVVPSGAVAGMACGAEIGPAAGGAQLHGFTASVALLEATAS